jgi:hypothetical protein
MLTLSPQSAGAQAILFGVKGGVPISSYFESSSTGGPFLDQNIAPAIRRYTAGVSIEWRSQSGLGGEFDAMYRRAHYAKTRGGFGPFSGELIREASDTAVNSWDFPMLLKYRVTGRVGPFATGGFALRHIGPARQLGTKIVENLITRTTTVTTIDTDNPPELTKRNYAGLVVGGGIEIRAGRVRFLPEFRYTGWLNSIPLTTKHQADFLLGILF